MSASQRKSPTIAGRAESDIRGDVQAKLAVAEVGSDGRCRLCTANDRDGVIEQLAADLLENRSNGHIDDRPWADAGEYWQRTFREFAETAIQSLSATS